MNVIAPSGVGIKIIENVINVIKDKKKEDLMIVGELVFCIAIGIFTVFIVSIISILLVIAELVLMMFPDLRVPWTITDNFLWEIEEDICQNEIKKGGLMKLILL